MLWGVAWCLKGITSGTAVIARQPPLDVIPLDNRCQRLVFGGGGGSLVYFVSSLTCILDIFVMSEF